MDEDTSLIDSRTRNERIKDGLKPGDKVSVEFKYKNGDTKKIEMLCRIDTNNELEYFKHGGILQYVLRNMI